MLSKNQKIPYKALPEEIKSYLFKKNITLDAWEHKFTTDEQSKVIKQFSIEYTTSTLNIKIKKETLQESYLTCKDSDRIIFEYLLSELVNNRSYFSLITGNSFFSRLVNCHTVILLHHVVRGRQTEADKMLQDKPWLLLEKGIAKDYTCTKDGKHYRMMEGTAFQLAIASKDVKYHADEVCMAEMIKSHFERLPGGEAELQRQYEDQFPKPNPVRGIKGWEVEAKARDITDNIALNNIFSRIAAIEIECNHDYSVIAYQACEKLCEGIIDKFRNYLDDQIKNHVIKTGFHFNDNLLFTAFSLYMKNFRNFGDNWQSPKNKLCWRKIVGYVLRFVPVCYAQAFCMSFYDYVGIGKKLERRLEFKYDPDSHIFPLDSSSGLGFEWNAFAGWGVARGQREFLSQYHDLRNNGLGTDDLTIFNLCRTKTISLQLLMQQPNQSTHNKCTIM